MCNGQLLPINQNQALFSLPTAGLTVTGTGTAGSGGTIANKTGADSAFATQGTGI